MQKNSVPLREQNIHTNTFRYNACKLQANPVICLPNNTGAIHYPFLFSFPFLSTFPLGILVYRPARASTKRYGFWL